MLLVGSRLGPYEIVSPLGSGGMGEVYRARDLRLDRDVAVKVLPEHLSKDSAALARFEREAKAVAALSHPNILSIHDFGVHQGICYAAMELLEGESLRVRISRSPFAWKKAIEIGIAIAEGLAAAHSKGVIHRDLKPENIFLTSDGYVKILDFGLMRWKPLLSTGDVSMAPTVMQTEPGIVLGTVDYMSPEQVRGEEVAESSDIFSLGCVLYEIVTGKRVFSKGTPAETIAAILKDEPEEIECGKNTPAELERIILHCLEKNSQARFHSSRDLAFALRGIEREQWQPSTKKEATFQKMIQAEQPSIAVLPFVDMSLEKDQEYFCDGITEELISALTNLEGLRVSSRTSAFQFRGKEQDIRKIGQHLNVSTVLEGSVRKAGNRIRIIAQLVKVEDGYHLWSEKFDREMADIFAIQDEIALAIVNKLKIKFKAETEDTEAVHLPLIKRYTENLEAYNLYLKGRYYWNERIHKAMEFFRLATEKDERYALAYTGIADSYSIFGLYGYIPPAEAFPKARSAAHKALEIDDTLPEAHLSMATVRWWFDWDFKAAERDFKRAIGMNPNFALAQVWYGNFLATLGRFEESLYHTRFGQQIDPLSPGTNIIAGNSLLLMGHYDLAIEEYRRVLEIEPNKPLALWYLGVTYGAKSLYEDALAALLKASDLSRRSNFSLALLGYLYGVSGKNQEAEQIMHELLERSKEQYVAPIYCAFVMIGLAEKDDVFEWLEKAFQDRNTLLTWIKFNPLMKSISSDSRFVKLLQRIGLA